MKVAVTGAAGFIGSHLVELLLSHGHSVVGIDNFEVGRETNLPKSSRFTFVYLDVSSHIDFLSEVLKDVDTVYHLAARADIVPSIELPLRYYEVNVTGTLNVCRASHAAGVKSLVYAASSSCYGIPDYFPTTELAEIRPQYPYALTKRLGEEIVLHWGKVYGIRSISLRFFNVYGTRARTSGTYGAVFGVFLAQKLANVPYTIVGDGTQTRDFTYVTDVANAIVTVGSEGVANSIYNIGSGNTVSINRIVELLGGDYTHIPKRPGEPDCTYADITKVISETSWKPEVSIEEGISLMVSNIDYWRDAPIWNPDSIATATKSWFKYLS
jgi:UDP-glucose 4-epimerase